MRVNSRLQRHAVRLRGHRRQAPSFSPSFLSGSARDERRACIHGRLEATRTLCARRGISLSLPARQTAQPEPSIDRMIQLPWRRIAAVLLPLALVAYAPPAGAQVTDSL